MMRWYRTIVLSRRSDNTIKFALDAELNIVLNGTLEIELHINRFKRLILKKVSEDKQCTK